MEKTPFTQEGLEMFDGLPAVEAVIQAWTDAGPNPTWHHRMQQILKVQMPVLTRALDRLVVEQKAGELNGNGSNESEDRSGLSGPAMG